MLEWRNNATRRLLAVRHSAGPLSSEHPVTIVIPDALRFFILGGCVGALAWLCGDGPLLSLWILLLPIAWGRTRTRLSASLLMAGYYLVSACGMLAGVASFFGEEKSVAFVIALWAAFGLWSTLPFALLWSKNKRFLPWSFVAALVLAMVPPLAVIGTFNPLMVSGILFPSLGWAGLLLTMATVVALGYRRLFPMLACLVIALVANALAAWGEVRVPDNWKGVDTHFDGIRNGGVADAGQILGSMRRIEWLKDYAKTVPAKSVTVLPETILGPMNALAWVSLEETERSLRAQGSVILAGAELPQGDDHYENVVLVLGAHIGEDRKAVQNIPVPIAMWKPWSNTGAVGDVFGVKNRIHVNGEPIAVLVCYEQLLPYAVLLAMASSPNVLVAVSNVHWARGTLVPIIQRRTVHAYARLFGVPLVQAANG